MATTSTAQQLSPEAVLALEALRAANPYAQLPSLEALTSGGTPALLCHQLQRCEEDGQDEDSAHQAPLELMLDAAGLARLPPEFFNGMATLHKLWLSNNGLRALPGEGLAHLRNLHSL